MLKGFPKAMSPDLIHCLAQMGHGDELVIADGIPSLPRSLAQLREFSSSISWEESDSC